MCRNIIAKLHKGPFWFRFFFLFLVLVFLSMFFLFLFLYFVFLLCVFVGNFFFFIMVVLKNKIVCFNGQQIISKIEHFLNWICIDLTQQKWPERRKSCAQDTIKSIHSAPVLQTTDQLFARRSIASSSSTAVTVARVASSASTLKKHRYGSRQRRLPPIHVKLAEENVPSEQSDSDSSCYDSFNEMETGSYKFN